jgi:hypothetical protein
MQSPASFRGGVGEEHHLMVMNRDSVVRDANLRIDDIPERLPELEEKTATRETWRQLRVAKARPAPAAPGPLR